MWGPSWIRIRRVFREFPGVFHLVISLDFFTHNLIKNRILYVSHNFLSWAHFRFNSNFETIRPAPFFDVFYLLGGGVGRATLLGKNLGLQTLNLEAYLLGDKFNNLVLKSCTLSICFQLGLLSKISNLLNSSWIEKPLSMAHLKHLFKSEFNFIPNMT